MKTVELITIGTGSKKFVRIGDQIHQFKPSNRRIKAKGYAGIASHKLVNGIFKPILAGYEAVHKELVKTLKIAGAETPSVW